MVCSRIHAAASFCETSGGRLLPGLASFYRRRNARNDVTDNARSRRGSATPAIGADELMSTRPADLKATRPAPETAGADSQDGAAMSAADVVTHAAGELAQTRPESNLPPAHGARWDADYRRLAVLVDALAAVFAASLGVIFRFGEDLSTRHLLLS